MGRQTKNFRQSAQSQAGNRGAEAYGQINRQGPGYGKIKNLQKVRGKAEVKIDG